MEFQIQLSPPPAWPAGIGPAPVTPLAGKKLVAEMRRIQEHYDRRRHLDRLTPEELKAMVAFQVAQQDIENRRDYFKTTPLERTFQGQVIPLVETLLGQDPGVRSVMNIGVRYAFSDHAMAARFPEVQFIGVDFMPNLAEMNADLRRDNLRFVSGYALDLIEKGDLRADLIFFSSTALTINNAELRRYLRLIAARARYFIVNEPLHHAPDGSLPNPLGLPVDGSVSVRIQPGVANNPPPNIIHNYAALAEEAGFEVLHHRIFPFPPFEPHVLQMVAATGPAFVVDHRFPSEPPPAEVPQDEVAALRARHEQGKDRSRLSAEELDEMVRFQVAVEDLPFRRGHFRDTPLPLTIQGRSVPLVERILRKDRSVRSVLDIGVRYAFIDDVLAAKYPHVGFIGADFMPNLAELNADFRRPNLRFEVGYALDLLESGTLSADVVLMVDTALTIRNLELRRYLRAIAPHAKYVVIDDPLHRSPGGGLEDPRGIPLDDSLPTYTPPVKITPLPGPLCYRHNYQAMLEEAGYRVVHYRVFQLAHYPLNLVTVVGERRS